MTKKDYEKFAKVIKAFRWFYHDMPEKSSVVRQFQTVMMDIFTSDNPRFDRKRFYEACEPKE